ncbi:hypothetical protein PLICRDRAFT_35521 [Plicaturopsis crispa FD-325 SS-3]|nr:hypothetical protein PLICRDRAFT_35521 [Plicaturopsis crispa FD-325 SS-3]
MSAASLSSTLLLRDDETENIHVVNAFLALQFIGGGGILIVLLTVLATRRLFRFSTWISFCVSWVISAFSYTLLALAGQQTGPEPQKDLCLVQAALIYGAPVLTPCTTLALVIQLRSNLKALVNHEDTKRVPMRTLALLIFPYVVYAGVLVEALTFSIVNLHTVQRNPSDMYCHASSGTPGQVSAVLCIIILVITVALETDVGFTLYRNWITLRNHGAENSQTSIWMTVRVLAFTFTCIIGIIVGATSSSPGALGSESSILLSLMPVIAFLIFGCQLDVLRVWTFWRRSESQPPPLPPKPVTIDVRKSVEIV